jgi:hypothetical protein
MTNEKPYCERLAGGFLRPNRAIRLLRLVFQTQPRSGDGGRDNIATGGAGGRLWSPFAAISRDIRRGREIARNQGSPTQESVRKRSENGDFSAVVSLNLAYFRFSRLFSLGCGRGTKRCIGVSAKPGNALLRFFTPFYASLWRVEDETARRRVGVSASEKAKRGNPKSRAARLCADFGGNEAKPAPMDWNYFYDRITTTSTYKHQASSSQAPEKH